MIDIAPGKWHEFLLPTFPEVNLQTGAKHVTGAVHPLSGKIYFTGGDFGGGGWNTSYRQETLSLDLAARLANPTDQNAGWTIEYPYCGGTPPQPKHPDSVGWDWNSKDNVFMLTPGLFVATSPNCTGESGTIASDANFIANRVMTFDPATKTWANFAGDMAGKSVAWQACYDPVSHRLYQFWYDGAHGQALAIFDIATKTWINRGYGSSPSRMSMVVSALDIEGRTHYAVDNATSHLYSHTIATGAFADLGPTPVASTLYQPCVAWDPINRLLYWHNNPKGTYAYDPATKAWFTLPLKTDSGLFASGRVIAFDYINNTLVLWGQNGPAADVLPSQPYMFLYRYNSGVTLPAPPTNLTISMEIL